VQMAYLPIVHEVVDILMSNFHNLHMEQSSAWTNIEEKLPRLLYCPTTLASNSIGLMEV
jgi:hypothetical protein